MRLSQSSLNLLSTCPRKFQHTYLEHLGSLITPDQQERLNWGSYFHLLMQQRELGLPIDSLVREDAQMQRWLTALVDTAPEILIPPARQTFRESEHCRILNFQEHWLTVIYDLLIADDDRAKILDWKTYPQPKNRQWLERDWQTRLYLYVMAETSDYSPEKISMAYWFVQSQPKPKSIKFTYNRAKHEQTRRDLIRLLTQLTDWLQRYEVGELFPQVPEDSNYCDYCQFVVRCGRTLASQEPENSQDLIPALADIQEVSL